jgi:hypothetical protein
MKIAQLSASGSGPDCLVQLEHVDGNSAIGRGGVVRVREQLIPVAVTTFAHGLPAHLQKMEGEAHVYAHLLSCVTKSGAVWMNAGSMAPTILRPPRAAM